MGGKARAYKLIGGSESLWWRQLTSWPMAGPTEEQRATQQAGQEHSSKGLWSASTRWSHLLKFPWHHHVLEQARKKVSAHFRVTITHTGAHRLVNFGIHWFLDDGKLIFCSINLAFKKKCGFWLLIVSLFKLEQLFQNSLSISEFSPLALLQQKFYFFA